MVHLLQTTSKTAKVDKETVPIPKFRLEEAPSIIYWWILTQLIGYAIYRVFLYVYKVLDTYGNGHSSISSYMNKSGKSRVSNFYTTSNDEYTKFITDPNDIFLDLSFVNKAFKFALIRGNNMSLDIISRHVQEFTNERNILNHNLLPVISFQEFQIKIKLLKEKFNKIIVAASEFHPENSVGMINLNKVVTRTIDKLLKKYEVVEEKSKQNKKDKDPKSNRTRFPKINS